MHKQLLLKQNECQKRPNKQPLLKTTPTDTRRFGSAHGEGVHGSTPLRLDVPASGTYLIKVGNYTVRKVVVVR